MYAEKFNPLGNDFYKENHDLGLLKFSLSEIIKYLDFDFMDSIN